MELSPTQIHLITGSSWELQKKGGKRCGKRQMERPRALDGLSLS